MEENKVFLLIQLINNLSTGFEKFEKSYNNSNKVAFDSAKKILLENQKKINLLFVKNNVNSY